jgi:acyl carrier protein
MDVRKIMIESILECTYLGLKSEDINDDTNMTTDLGFDSIIFIQVIVTIEEKLNMSLSNDVLEIDNIFTFSDFYNRVQQCIEGK